MLLPFARVRIREATGTTIAAAARVSALVLVVMAVTHSSHAQVLYGSLTGNVTDRTGAVAVGARVRAINAGTGVEKTTATNDRGVYLFNDLQPGNSGVRVQGTQQRTSGL